MIFFLSLHEIYSIAHLLKLQKTLLWSLMIKKAYNSKKLTITFSGVTSLKKIGFFSLAGIQQQEINHNIFRCQIIQKNSGFFSLAVPVHVFLAVKVGVGSKIHLPQFQRFFLLELLMSLIHSGEVVDNETRRIGVCLFGLRAPTIMMT